MTAFWVKFLADDILNHFSYFSYKSGFDMMCKLPPMETVCMNCLFPFSGINKKKDINVLSAKLAQRLVMV